MDAKAPSKSVIVRFGDFELDLRALQLRSGGVLTRLQPQPAKILGILAANSGALVTREQIRREVWGDNTFIDFDQSLNFCIRQIRDVLGDDSARPRFLETLPRRGYRFLAAIEAAQTALPDPAADPIRVAVRPFRFRDEGESQDYLNEGFSEEVMTALSRVGRNQIRVIARATMVQCARENMDLARLRRELRVRYLVEGSVWCLSGQVRIGVHLVDLNDETVIWADNYERRNTQLFGVLSEVAWRVARSLAQELLPGNRPQPIGSITSPHAYEAYLKGRHFSHKLTKDGLLAASTFFKESIEIDPNFGPAYAGLADCYAQMGSIRVALLTCREALAKAKPLAVRAIELNDELADAHNALALVRCWYEWDWPGAGSLFRRALELDPNSTSHSHWYALYLLAVGESEKAFLEIQRARDIDPLSPILNLYTGIVLWLTEQFDRACHQLRYAIQLDTANYRPYLFYGLTLWAMGLHEEARAMMMEAEARDANNVETIAFRAALDATKGGRATAIIAVRHLKGLGIELPLLEAIIHVALGQHDEAFACIERAISTRSNPIYILRIDPAFTSLKCDPRYRSALRRVGLPPYHLAAAISD